MNIDLAQAKRQLNQTAGSYADAAIIPREVQERLVDRLSFIKCQPAIIVDIGCGDGTLLNALRPLYPTAHYVGLDLAISRLDNRNMTSVCADAHQLPFADHSIDLIISSLALHWTLDLEKVLGEISRVLKPQGLLMFSTLGPDTLLPLTKAFGEDTAQHVLPFYDMHDIGDGLLRNHFVDPVMDAEHITVNYSTTQRLFDDLRAMGETQLLSTRRKTLTGKKRWQQMLEKLIKQKNDNALPIPFEIIYGHAWGAEKPKTTSSGREFRVSIADIPIRRQPTTP